MKDEILTEEQAVAETIRKQVKGMIDGDLDLLKEVISPDAVFYHITGAKQSRDEWLRQVKLGRMHYFGSREILMQATVNGDEARVISRNQLDARIYGFRNTWPLESRAKLRKIDGKWQIVESRASMF
ncbi:nuclear transport factor 2 family protein [Lactobacillus helveticus]|uniref:nuclear transport factor 2 family protein n=1 Tax=Lactobacillus helveticus TaxID=1587 RepID=UPI000CD87660|nr:nuclear transport factor 2 family protein [Lactobacillus helveticus]MBO1882415.1 nuclear transport factor 2 family protein [Lactobacillus helveticus]POO30770.1 putative lumazine-binding protein [Lactobacillus helveticus]QYH34304.1 nuclear transport factor 2 family protein [Lactobacillus helveticus]GFP08832.1 hypothetical protein LHEJCM1006_09780 [Lactobacillus helveticus]GFP18401.1 hypothetical protein LHEJCM20397_19490 [Lactobacillus helveticus]